MGCNHSKATKTVDKKATAPLAAEKQASAVPQKKLDPKDFMYRSRKAEVIVREPGTIDGQQILLDGCEDCDIYLLDHMSQVTVDFCKSSRIFIGPVESSIFIRDCTDCRFVVACQQFRMRDCSNCQVMLYSHTRPVIETSKNIGFACFDLYYDQLEGQFHKAKLSPFNNPWGVVHDFNKAQGNWHFLPENMTYNMFLNPLPEGTKAVLAPPGSAKRVVPLTASTRPTTSNERAFILFFPHGHQHVATLLQSIPPKYVVIQCGEHAIHRNAAQDMFGTDKKSMNAAIRTGTCIGLVLCGDGAGSFLRQQADRINMAEYVCLVPGDDERTSQLMHAFFAVDEDSGHTFGGGAVKPADNLVHLDI